jgi:hypothetical protein
MEYLDAKEMFLMRHLRLPTWRSVLLLDRPALMCQEDEGSQRRRGGQVDEVVLQPAFAARLLFAQ